MKHVRTLILPLLLVAGCGSCPPGTLENAANVAKLVAENDALAASVVEPASVKDARRLRNAAAQDLAGALAAACNR